MPLLMKKVMRMNKTIYKQLDSRWASKPYPTYSSSFGGNGCGCCACVHVAIEQDAKKKWTPETLRPWMVSQGFAYVNQGTTWQGITETLKYIGHKNVVCVWNDPMSSAWKELNKGNRIGVLLVDNGRTPDGTYWTSSGHYVAFTDYKVSGGKHYFYIKDSGFRNHDGWYAYETSIKGALPKMWIVERIGSPANLPKPKKGKYTGKYPSTKTYFKYGAKGENVKRLQAYLNWSYGGQKGFDELAVDGDYGNNTLYWTSLWQDQTMGEGQGNGEVGAKTIAKMKEYGSYSPTVSVKPTTPKPYSGKHPTMAQVKVASNNGIHNRIVSWCKNIANSDKYHYVSYSDDTYTHLCPICHPRTYDLGWNCIGFAWASWRHGGGLGNSCSCDVLNDADCERLREYTFDNALALAKRKIGLNDITLIRDNRGLAPSLLKKGDVILYFNSNNTYKHTAVYIGDGKIADDSGANSPNIRYGKSYYYDSDRICKVAVRYTGGHTYLTYGDEGTAVARLQKFLNWWGGYKLNGKGKFGKQTQSAVIKFKGKNASDHVGEKTLAKMKKTKK
jgi:peptidoglycan hydrolase-like protein with peptidoglycan-binding domain